MAAMAVMNDSQWLAGGGGSSSGKKIDAELIEQWWDVNPDYLDGKGRGNRSGATPLVARCIRVYGWSQTFALRTLRGYRQFMELKSVMQDWTQTKLAAPIPVQEMWQQHVLDNLRYNEDCLLLCGRVVGHDPDVSAHSERSVMAGKVRTTLIAFQARYGDDCDRDVWDFGPLAQLDFPDLNKAAIDAESTYDLSSGGVNPRSSAGRLPVASVRRGVERSNTLERLGRFDRVSDNLVTAHDVTDYDGSSSNRQGRQQYLDLNDRNRYSATLSENEDDTANNARPGEELRVAAQAVVAARTRSPMRGEYRPSSPLRARVRSSTLSPLRAAQAAREAVAASRASSPLRSSSKSPGNEPLTLILQNVDSGEETFFSVRPRSTLRVVFSAYADRKGLNPETISYSWNGKPLTGYETPYGMGLEDRACIEVRAQGSRRP